MYLLFKISVLDEAAKAHPNTWWWIKADGADLVSGLGESVKGIWSGDVDLADGALAQAYKQHQQQIDHISLLGQAAGHTSKLDITRDLTAVEQEVIQNMTFVSSSTSCCNTNEPSHHFYDDKCRAEEGIR